MVLTPGTTDYQVEQYVLKKNDRDVPDFIVFVKSWIDH